MRAFYMVVGVVAGLLLSTSTGAQAPGFGFSVPPGVQVQEEGTPLAGRTTTLNCVGSTITCAGAPVTTITVTGGSGSANVVEVSLAMTGGAGFYTATVTGQAWVTAASVIVCAPFGSTADGLTPEQVQAASMTVSASTRVAGVGFDVNVANPYGSHGTHRFHCTGA